MKRGLFAAAAALYGAGGEGGRIRLAAGGTLFLEDSDRLAVELHAVAG